MTLKNAFTLIGQPTTDWPEFIYFWGQLGDYLPINEAYTRYLINYPAEPELDAASLRQLLKWEAITGEDLDGRLANQMIAQLPIINQLTKSWDEVLFNRHFDRFPAAWQMYLMHLVQPEHYPVFDPYVYRAHCYLQTGNGKELKGPNEDQLAFYKRYRAFFGRIRRAHPQLDPRLIDKALWVFGRFLKENRKLVRKPK